jgi:ABC-type nitrate/sulfonate/bicarbonate transport system ATPase subunit
MKLQMRQQMRRSQEEIEANFDPINLNYIFQEDLLFQWIEERENLLLDGVQKCLMVVYSR